jgi:PAS domain S-box-containing protein
MRANVTPKILENRIRFLVVDDELVIARDLQLQIDRLGYHVVGVAPSAAQAISLVKERKPDIVLMDIQLGGGTDGIQAAHHIREAFGVPSVFITSYADEETLLRAQLAQPLGYILKPVRPGQLGATLLMSVAQHKLTQALGESLTWLRSLVGQIPESVFVADRHGAVSFMNRAAELLTGSRSKDSVGQQLSEVLRAYDADSSGSGISGPADFGNKSPRRAVVTAADGRETPVEYTMFELTTGNQIPPERIIVVRDITDRLRIERLLKVERDSLAVRVAHAAEELDRTKDQLRALAASLMHAQEDERRRIARDLHDDISQQLACLQIKAEHLANIAASDERFRDELATLRSLFHSLSEQVRSLSHRLHPSTLDLLGLPIAIRSLVRELGERNPEMVVSTAVPETPITLSSDIAIGVYRIASECLRNIEKHASASAVSLKLSCRRQKLRLVVRDYGSGFNPYEAPRGLGLISMQERALAMAGTLSMFSIPGEGTLVALSVPLGENGQA